MSIRSTAGIALSLAITSCAPALDPASPLTLDNGSVVLQGLVRDRAWDEGLEGVVVLDAASSRRAATDSTGRFSLRVPTNDTLVLSLTKVGYHDDELTALVDRADSIVSVDGTMAPKPGVLAQLETVWDTLTSSVAPLYLFTPADLIAAGHTNALDFLTTETFFSTTPCAFNSFHPTCTSLNGFPQRVWLRVDLGRPTGQFTPLRSIPPEELGAVILHGRGTRVSVFTRQAIESYALDPEHLSRLRRRIVVLRYR